MNRLNVYLIDVQKFQGEFIRTSLKLKKSNVPNEGKLPVRPGDIGTHRLIGNILEFLGREVGSIGDRPQMRDEGCANSTNLVPVYASEERMSSDRFNRESVILSTD